MEEQRKKREEVLKMKEERRRQKLATMSGKDEFSSVAIPTQPGNSGFGKLKQSICPFISFDDPFKKNFKKKSS